MEKKAGGNAPRSSTLARAIATIEERIATAPVEHAVVFDEHGTLLVNKVGEHRAVAFTAAIPGHRAGETSSALA